MNMIKILIFILIVIILLIFIGWIIWNEIMCTGTLGNNMCSNTYWYMLGLK